MTPSLLEMSPTGREVTVEPGQTMRAFAGDVIDFLFPETEPWPSSVDLHDLTRRCRFRAYPFLIGTRWHAQVLLKADYSKLDQSLMSVQANEADLLGAYEIAFRGNAPYPMATLIITDVIDPPDQGELDGARDDLIDILKEGHLGQAD